MEDINPEIDSGSCAYAAIRKHIGRLNRSVATCIHSIPEKLFEEELIDDETYELYLNTTITDSEKGRKITREVQKRVRFYGPEGMKKLLNVLKSEKLTEELADEIEGKLSCNCSVK